MKFLRSHDKVVDKSLEAFLASISPTKKQLAARRKRHAKQQKKWGFCDAELWDFNRCIVTFVLPRLIRFRKMRRTGYPQNLSPKRWEKILDRIIQAFKLLKRGLLADKKEEKIITRGLELFAKHFEDLWD